VATVIGPTGLLRLWLVYSLTKDRIRVDFPTPGGPTTQTRGGGPSTGVAALRSF
jgi:hypothetical protein